MSLNAISSRSTHIQTNVCDTPASNEHVWPLKWLHWTHLNAVHWFAAVG